MKLEFQKGSVTIGRGPENDIVLANDPRISRQHVEIKQSMGQFYVINLSQKNFVLLNGINVTSEKMDSKATVQVGDSEMSFWVHGSTNLLEPVSPNSVSVQRSRPVAVPNLPPTGMPGGLPSAMPGGHPMMPQQPGMPPAPGFPPPYQGPRPGAAPHMHHRPAVSGSPIADLLSNPRVKTYGGIAIACVLIFMMLPGGKSKRAEEKPFRTMEELNVSRQESENEIKAFQERKDKMNQQIYQKAYENFLRGHRDYRQGQFVRAREAFQVVLNLDPENDLARRYLNLSKIRFDEIVKFHLLQGRRYLEKQNYRMCKANFQTVMTMLGNDPSNPEYKEALTMHKQCSVALEGRF
jgi:hypothetical protein